MRKIFSFTIILMLVISFISCKRSEKEELLLFVGAGMKKPMDELKEMYERERSVKINIVYGGSGSILSQIETTKRGDIFMPGSMYHYKVAEDKGLVEKGIEFLYHIPVIIVKKNNPKGINNLFDLSKKGIKLALGDEEAVAIGPVTKEILEKAGIYKKVEKNVVVREGTVSKLVLDVNSEFVDASIVWRSSAIQFGEDLKIIPIENKYNVIKTIPIGVVKFTKNYKLSRNFVSFITSYKGKSIFEKYGFVVKGEED